jgi:cytochrome c-type biogenesis protein CcmH
MATAIANAAPDDRQAMIRSMVAGLAAKLDQDPGNLDGWLRLTRAYQVLGESEKASSARSRAAALIATLPIGTARTEAQERLDAAMQ